jgi:transposase InsO family protein
MEQRQEFVRLALVEGANHRELCRRFGISPAVGYKWIERFKAGDEALADRSRRPCGSPRRCRGELEAAVVAMREAHPAWGARKIACCLQRTRRDVPAVSTVHAILRRHDLIQPVPGGAAASQRFEKEAPNLLWQMDFKGHIALGNGQRCHPLTVVDDHSRYALCIAACANERGTTVCEHLRAAFRCYGLPQAVFVDNGTPWGDSSGHRWTRFGVWLLKLGVDVLHSRPYHPQSRGKNERFHRSLKAEVFELNTFRTLEDTQHALDAWRSLYNCERPHQALDMNVPASRYRVSPRVMPERIPQPEYDEGEIVRTVPATKDYIRFKGRLWKVPQAFRGERVAIRPIAHGIYGVFFASHQIATIDLTTPKPVSHVSEQVFAMSPE